MNDLAELALRGLDQARRRVLRHPVVALGVSGFVVSATIVVAGGRLGASPQTRPLSSWFGLLPDNGGRINTVLGALMLASIAALLGLWLSAITVLRSGRCGESTVWTLAASWAAPFAIGPPILATDVYTYTGQGLLSRAGLDPYATGPASLGTARIVSAIDPTWRSARSTEGPLAVFVQHLAEAITGGHALATVVVLRALGVGCAVAIGILAMEIAGPRRVPALAITVLNPAVLCYVVSSPHFEGPLAVLLLGSLVAAARRRWLLAVVLVCAGAALKPVALVAVPAVLVAHAVGYRSRPAWRIAARDLAVAALTLTALTLLVRDGLGWRHNLDTLTREHTPFAPASILSDAIRPLVPAASFDDVAVGGRITVVLAAIGVVAYLLATMRARPLDRTVGFSLLAVGLLSPVLYPWYLLWGTLCLAPAAVGARRDWVVALSAVACVLMPAGVAVRTAHPLTFAALVVIGSVLAPSLYRHRSRTARLSEA